MRKLVPFLFSIVAMAGQTAAQTPTLATPGDTFSANAAPRSIVSADFNGDGLEDVALGGTGRDSITIVFAELEALDDGSWHSISQDIVIGGGPFELAAADLNRDGRPDIAVANADANAVTILLNTGFGRFDSPPINVAVPQNPRGLAIADINRDGKLDIVVTKYLGTSLDVLIGAGNGTFPTRRTYAALSNSQGVATGDFNNDGWTDFVVASASGTMAMYFTGPAVDVVWTKVPISMAMHVVTTGDFNRDGRLDFAAASSSHSVARVFYGSGSYAAPTIGAAIPTAASPRGIETADLNRDGVLELLLAGRASSTVSVLTRQADGSYANEEFAAGPGARDLTVLSDEGTLVVATANEFGNSVTFLGNVTPLKPPAFAFDILDIEDEYDNSTYGIADFNHNGKPDLVRKTGVLLDNTTRVRVSSELTQGGATADFNGDGHPDVVFAVYNTLRVYLGNGQGAFTAGPVMNSTVWPGLIRTADINADGRADLVTALGFNDLANSAIEVWTGLGDGRFVRAYHADTYPANDLELADVDRNGTTDILVTSRNGLLVFLTDRTGTVFTPKWSFEGSVRFGLAIGYVNYDGALDVVMNVGSVDQFGPRWTARVAVAFGNGDGTFRETATYDLERADEPGDVFRYVNLGDLNHDGFLDLLTGNGGLLLGSLTGEFQDPQWFEPISWDEALIADVTGDGLNDVLGYTMYVGGSHHIVMRNTLRQPNENRGPIGLDLPPRGERAYAAFFDSDDQYDVCPGEPYDPDLHLLRFRWTTQTGHLFSTWRCSYPNLGTGTYQITVTANDLRGKSASDTMEYVITPHKESVIWTMDQDNVWLHGAWRRVADSTAAGGERVHHPNANAPKLNAPLANPTDYIEVAFLADKTQTYKLWLRLKAENNYWGNDSVWVQFSGAADASGNPLYRIGSTSGLAVNLEECSGCGISGWGWEDDGWGAVNRNGTILHFPEGGLQYIRIQTREDGVSIDQIVLSAETYRTTRPGAAKNDTTILRPRGPF